MGGYSSVVEDLSSIYEVLGSISRVANREGFVKICAVSAGGYM